jgi:hypothetical protein
MRFITLHAALLVLAAWADQLAGQEAHVLLDRRTGTTLQITRDPWVLALDQPHLAAHARDYVALHAI